MRTWVDFRVTIRSEGHTSDATLGTTYTLDSPFNIHDAAYLLHKITDAADEILLGDKHGTKE